MCDLCIQAQQHILLAGAEHELILAETLTGTNVAFASRPLSDAEKEAKIRFGELEDNEQAAMKRAETILRTLRGAIGASILGNLLSGNDAVNPATAVAKLTAMSADQPKAVRQAIAAAIPALERLLSRSYTAASTTAIGEAKRQGVKDLPKPLEPSPGAFAAVAAVTAAYPWRRITGKLSDTLISPQNIAGPSLSRAIVLDQLEQIPLDGAVDLARQSIHGATNTGRFNTAEVMEPRESFASEILDRNTCSNCEGVDGKDYDTLAAARDDYTDGGGYRACLGGSRCRGTLALIY